MPTRSRIRRRVESPAGAHLVPLDGSRTGAPVLPCFVHINHNAGNTVRHVLRGNYPRDRLLDVMVLLSRSVNGGPVTTLSPDEPVVHVVAEVVARQWQLGCVAWNLPVGLGRLLERPVQEFIFLRDPVERCITTWYWSFSRINDGGRSWALFERHGFDVPRLVESGVGLTFSNQQLRLITGTPRIDVGQEEFDAARELIESGRLLVGVVESFDRDLHLIARRMGWAERGYRRQNVGDKSNPSALPAAAIEAFRELNEWDLRLYRWVTTEHLPGRC